MSVAAKIGNFFITLRTVGTLKVKFGYNRYYNYFNPQWKNVSYMKKNSFLHFISDNGHSGLLLFARWDFSWAIKHLCSYQWHNSCHCTMCPGHICLLLYLERHLWHRIPRWNYWIKERWLSFARFNGSIKRISSPYNIDYHYRGMHW